MWLLVPELLGTLILGSGALFAKGQPHKQLDTRPGAAGRPRTVSSMQAANILSTLLFSYLTPLLRLGYKRPLMDEDLDELAVADQAETNSAAFIAAWQREVAAKGNAASLFRVLHRVYGWSIWSAGIPKVLNDTAQFIAPYLLMQLLGFVQDSQPQTATNSSSVDSSSAMPPFSFSSSSWEAPSIWIGVLLCGALTLNAILQTFFLQAYFFRGYRASWRLRAGLAVAIYEKCYRLSPSARRKTSAGEIVTLMSVDLDRLKDLIPNIHLLWSCPVQIIVSIGFLWALVGPSILAGCAAMALMIPLSGLLAKRMGVVQTEMLAAKDKRSSLMNELLNGIRIVKFFAWESRFEAKIAEARNEEVKKVRTYAYMNSLSMILWTALGLVVALATFSAYALTGNKLTAGVAYTALSLFLILEFPMSMFPSVVSATIQARASLGRLQAFFLAEELDPGNVTLDLRSSEAISIEDASFSWGEADKPDDEESNEREPNHSNELLALANIDLHIPKGALVAVVGRVGAGKSSLLHAILGGLTKHSGRVRIAGSIGYVSQQAWIQNCSVRENILFGLPFDAARYQEVIELCQLTQDIAIFPSGDSTEIGEKGINLSGGQKQRISCARALYREADIYLFDDPLSAVDAHVGRAIFRKAIRGKLAGKTRVLVTHHLAYAKQADFIYVVSAGRLLESGTYEKLMAAKGEFARLVEEHVTNEQESEPGAVGVSGTGPGTAGTADKTEAEGKEAKIIAIEDRSVGSLDSSVYRLYGLGLGGTALACLVVGCYLFDLIARVGLDSWLSVWSSADDATEHVTYYLGIYAAFGLSCIALSIGRAIFFANRTVRAATVFHNNMLGSLLKAPLGFFDTTPIGRILNRFTKDTAAIDEAIPRFIDWWLSGGWACIALIVVIAAVIPFFLIGILPIAYLYNFIQQFYLRSSRELKRLSSISNSPVLALLSETLNGVPTIRSFAGAEQRLIQLEKSRVDSNMRPTLLGVVANRWLGLRLDFLGAAVICSASLFAVLQREFLSPGLAGLAVTYAVQLTGLLTWFVRSNSELETQLVAVERAAEYARLPEEAAAVVPGHRPPADWPQAGAIRFENISLRYREGLELALTNCSVEIRGREKIGICGRTGAGKSTLMLALFRLVEPAEGRVWIDGLDIAKIGLHDLRSRISIIPQDPTLFAGTVRSNLDPFSEYPAEALWDALGQCHLAAFFRGLDGLETAIADNGENLSVGQRQLMCVGRALLRKRRILVMDEATAAIDMETDALIQQTIREAFVDVTVLTIAHRLNTILDYDRILVLDQGRVAQFGPPSELARVEGIFAKLLQESGEKLQQ